MHPVKMKIGILSVSLALLAPICLTAEGNKTVEVKNLGSAVASSVAIAKPAAEGKNETFQESKTILFISTLSGRKTPKRLVAAGQECTAGGPGATTCSLGECSVKEGECKGDGQYACCNADFCGCSGSAAY